MAEQVGGEQDPQMGQLADPPWLTPDQQCHWRSVMALLMTLPSALDAQLKQESGINTFEYHVLVRLGDRPDGSMAMGELAQLTQGSPSRLSHAVTRLERAGWIERQGGASRCVNARLTPAGREKLVESAPGHVREVRRLVIDQLTAEQLASLGTAARIVAETAEPHLASTLGRRSDAPVSSGGLGSSGGSGCVEEPGCTELPGGPEIATHAEAPAQAEV